MRKSLIGQLFVTKDRNGCWTPEYVVARARWQKSRGRKPSIPFRGEKNPRKALAMAIEELRHFKGKAGNQVLHNATRAVRNARLIDGTVMADMGLIRILVKPDTRPGDILRLYQEEDERQLRACQNSPAYQENEREKIECQTKVNELVARLPELDFSNLVAVIDWLETLGKNLRVGVNKPWQLIVDTFGQHGFVPGTSCGKSFNEEDEISYAGWIIEASLNELVEVGLHSIHNGLLSKFVGSWRQKFHSA